VPLVEMVSKQRESSSQTANCWYAKPAYDVILKLLGTHYSRKTAS